MIKVQAFQREEGGKKQGKVPNLMVNGMFQAWWFMEGQGEVFI